MQSTLSTVSEAVKDVMSSIAATDKVNDLKRDTVEAKPGSILTTDHGVKVRDTDNWCVAAICVHL
jgi:hypothetical protein